MSKYVIESTDGRSILNDFVIFKLRNAQTGQRLAIVEHVLRAGELGSPTHTHSREDEYSFVLEGELSAEIGDELVKGGPGGLLLKPRDIPHSFFNQGATPLRILELLVPGDFEGYFDELAEIVAASQGQPEAAALLALAKRYGMEMDLNSTPGLMAKYGVHLPGAPGEQTKAGEPL